MTDDLLEQIDDHLSVYPGTEDDKNDLLAEDFGSTLPSAHMVPEIQESCDSSVT